MTPNKLFEMYRDGGAEDSLENWQRCNFCGEMYHVNNGHFVPRRGISACEYCVKEHGHTFTLERYHILPQSPGDSP